MSKSTVNLAVNGTLMRDLSLNDNLLNIGASFVREDTTGQCYRLWSINDVHPAMQRVKEGGESIALEIWAVPTDEIVGVLKNEPRGLCIGKVLLSDGSEVLGVVGENFLCEGQKEITAYKGWRAYTKMMDAS